MKSLRMKPDRSLHLIDLPEAPPPGPREICVQMAYASICGFDMMMQTGKAAYPRNGIMGHEGSGVVSAVGAQVTDFAPGDRVAILPYQTCGLCDACRSNRPHYCINPSGRADLMTEYITLDQSQVFKLPDNLSLRAGCLIEPLMMAMHTASKARLEIGSTVIILGGGAMGQIILRLVRQHPVSKIVLVDPHASKRELALQAGADVVLDAADPLLMSKALLQTGNTGYDAVIEASGSHASAQMALNLVARGGSVVYFGLYGMDFNLEVNLFNLYWKDASISCVCVPSGCFPAAIAVAHHMRLEEVITGLFPFSQAVEAFAEKSRGEHAKVMLYFGSAPL